MSHDSDSATPVCEGGDLCVKLSGGRINITHPGGDAQLGGIHEIIDGERCVTGRLELSAVLDGLRESCGSHPPDDAANATLDLIDHSTAMEHSLQLGTFEIRYGHPSRDLEELIPLLKETLRALNIHRVRLLGCRTAVGAEARTTLMGLTRDLSHPDHQVLVYGSIAALDRNHFDDRGLKPTAEQRLRHAAELGPDVPLMTSDVSPEGRTETPA